MSAEAKSRFDDPAAASGRTEVHFFEGKVELLARSAATQSLGKGEASVVEGGAAPRFMAASAAAFASLFEFQQRSLASEAFRCEQWQSASFTPKANLICDTHQQL